MYRWKLLTIAIVAALTAHLLSAPAARAVPDFSFRAASDCADACHNYLGELPQIAANTRCSLSCLGCHVNPAGGGMRNAAGVRYAQRRVSTDWVAADDALVPEAGKFIRFGADLKVLSLDPDSRSEDEYRSFFVMESGAYLSIEPHRNLILVLEHDLRNSFGQYYAMIKNLPLNMYLIAGRFLVPYGLKVNDHTAFIRKGLGFDINSQDEGLLVGLNPGRPYVNLAYTNGNRGSRGFDRNDEKAVTGNLGYAHEWFHAGASYYRDPTPGQELTLLGGYGGVRAWKLSLLAEYDAIDADGGAAGIATLAQLNFFPIQGVNVMVQHELFDPDTDVDKDDHSRVSVGIQLFPMPFLELDARFRHITDYGDIPSEPKKDSGNEFVFILHGFI